jgi:phosphoserine phosphatase
VVPLVAVDVDRTLLKIDSFRELVLARLDLTLVGLLALRALRLLSRESFAERVTRHLQGFLEDAPAVDRFVDRLFAEIDPAVLEMAHRAAGPSGVIVLVSASPEAYVSRLAARLGAFAVGSRFADGVFQHCYGERKLPALEARFARARYDYVLAVADDPSDSLLLAAFRESFWWKR